LILIARLGGYVSRKRDKPPGFECLWKGYARFQDKVSGVVEFLKFHSRRCPEFQAFVQSFLPGVAQGERPPSSTHIFRFQTRGPSKE
jgi:hypothetical protein